MLISERPDFRQEKMGRNAVGRIRFSKRGQCSRAPLLLILSMLASLFFPPLGSSPDNEQGLANLHEEGLLKPKWETHPAKPRDGQSPRII